MRTVVELMRVTVRLLTDSKVHSNISTLVSETQYYGLKPSSHLFCLRCVATGSAYEMICSYVGIEKSSIPALQRASKSFHMHFRSQRNASKKDVNLLTMYNKRQIRSTIALN